MTQLTPYITFRGDARRAADFYHHVLGGQLDLQTYADMPEFASTEAQKDLIIHAHIHTPAGVSLMLSDTTREEEHAIGNTFSVSISGSDETELRGYWDRLLHGGTVLMPMENAPWGAIFGMLVDQFGITWMINVDPAVA